MAIHYLNEIGQEYITIIGVVTGPPGSGKTTLLEDLNDPAFEHRFSLNGADIRLPRLGGFLLHVSSLDEVDYEVPVITTEEPAHLYVRKYDVYNEADATASLDHLGYIHDTSKTLFSASREKSMNIHYHLHDEPSFDPFISFVLLDRSMLDNYWSMGSHQSNVHDLPVQFRHSHAILHALHTQWLDFAKKHVDVVFLTELHTEPNQHNSVTTEDLFTLYCGELIRATYVSLASEMPSIEIVSLRGSRQERVEMAKRTIAAIVQPMLPIE